MDITRYLVDCCVMQEDTTPEAFVGMTRAYYYVLQHENRFLTLDDLRIMNMYIRGGDRGMALWRTVPAFFSDGSFVSHADNIPRLMNQWHDFYKTSIYLTPDYAYFELMRIHPFVDGNGRVGSLVWNHMRVSLGNPEHPPKYKDLKERFSKPANSE